MRQRADRLAGIWRRTFSLAWPIAIQQFLNTLMRTVDVLVTGLFSPAAVAAVGLADLYSDIPRRVGSSLGTGAITLSSQDTGRGATASRDAAVSQALLLGAVAGLPFIAAGALLAHLAIAVLGAAPEVVRLGGTYLAIVFAVAPMRIVGYVGASALQGTGDTRTPMFVNGASNVINIVGTVGLGLGLAGLPRLGIVGVGLATAVARTVEAVAILAAILSDRTAVALSRPRSLTVTRQLLALGVPRFAEQMSIGLAAFPFNAILVGFGTEAVAAYHIARRVYTQLGGPLYRTYSTATSIIVGQSLGEGDPEGARSAGFAIVGLGVVTVGVLAVAMVVWASGLAAVFSTDRATVAIATDFVRTFSGVLVFAVPLFVFAGGLRSAGDTRTPFYAQFTGQFGFTVGFSYLVGVVGGYGLPGVFAGLVLTYVWGAAVVGVAFSRGRWAETAASLMDERSAAFD